MTSSSSYPVICAMRTAGNAQRSTRGATFSFSVCRPAGRRAGKNAARARRFRTLAKVPLWREDGAADDAARLQFLKNRVSLGQPMLMDGHRRYLAARHQAQQLL